MAVLQILGPTDVSDAIITAGGELVAIDARGTPWTFQPNTERTDAQGEKISNPTSFAHAFVLNERLTVLDSNDMWWTYDAAASLWTAGPSLQDKEEAEGAMWIKSRNLEHKTVAEPKKEAA